MKKTFRAHIVLMLEGRLLLMMLATVPLLMLYGIIVVFANSPGVWIVPYSLFFVFIIWACVWVENYFWQHCWGKLIITEDAVIWKCLFYKPIILTISEIKYADIRSFQSGNVFRNRDFYKTGFKYLLLSSMPLPNKRIDKIRSGRGLIKFRYTPKIGQVLHERLPSPYNSRFRPKR